MSVKLPTIAIVGRPNVGKSTFFNRIIGHRKAIVDDVSGVTRDRHYGESTWNGKDFTLIDTGGYIPENSEVFAQGIREQVHLALDEADLILFVVDVEIGITDLDSTVAEILRRRNQHVIVVANKADNPERTLWATEFYGLGFEDIFPVSSVNGMGTGDLLDRAIQMLPPPVELESNDDIPKVAIIGRPNVGKSSLLNQLLNDERSIVSEVAGTTRDSINSILDFHGKQYELIDTAGLRRKTKVKESIEFYSTIRTQKAIKECDVALLLLDATQGLESQDIKVLREAERYNKGIILILNKWDLIDKETNTLKTYIQSIYDRIPTMKYIPVLSISALSGQRVLKVMDKVDTVIQERRKEVTTGIFNRFLEKMLIRQPLPFKHGNQLKIKYATQVKSKPPVFAFFMNNPRELPPNYRRFIEGSIRDEFGFEGVPITLVFKEK